MITATSLVNVCQELFPWCTLARTGVEPTTSSGLYIDETLLIRSITSFVPTLLCCISVCHVATIVESTNFGKAS